MCGESCDAHEAEIIDAHSEESSSLEDRSTSSAEDGDLAWVAGEDGRLDSDADDGEGPDKKVVKGEKAMAGYMASSLSSFLVCDLATRRQQQELQEQQRDGDDSAAGSHCPVGGAGAGGGDAKKKVCCICGDNALYTCPGCGARTCSIICVRVHKTQFNCAGERNIAKKVPLKEFTDTQLQRDFQFLEDVRRVVSNCERGFSRIWHYTFRALPPPLHALREAAKKRGVVCQITSEGMAKRDANTSRFDRKTETIIWRCQFNFHSPDFTVTTDWGSERHRLGDIAAYCWATNPPLPSYHINRRYNSASKWIGGAAQKKRVGAEDVEGEETKEEVAPDTKDGGDMAEEVKEKRQQGETRQNVPSQQQEDGEPQETTVSAVHSGEESTVRDMAESGPRFVDHHAQQQEMWSPCQVHVAALSAVEEANERAVATFFQKEPVVILARAERLGTQRKYFRLSPTSTLNEALRTLFFVNEYPVFDVIHESALDAYPLVTEADKEYIREGFRAAPRPPKPERRPRRTKADLTPEEAERCGKVPCRMFLAGCCRLAGDECPYWHCAHSDVPACRSFVKFAACEKGDRCSFRHDPAAVGAARKRAREERRPPGVSGRGRRRES